MGLLILHQFSALLWKNFTLKRRHFFDLIMDGFTALLFPTTLLLFRVIIKVHVIKPQIFYPQNISTLPLFLKNPNEWELIYVPSNIDVLKDIIENVKSNLNISIKVNGFSSETELDSYIKYGSRSRKVLAAIVFDCDFKTKYDPLPLQVKYYLRFFRTQKNVSSLEKVDWETSLLFPIRSFAGPRNPNYNDGGNPGYIKEGFVAVQHALDKAIMLYHESSAREIFDSIHVLIQRFPYPHFSQDGLIGVISSFAPLMFILMFSPTVLSNMRFIVSERESRLKEYQIIIGLRNWMIWAAYFFTFILTYIILIFLICVLFFAKIINEPIFRNSDFSFIFAFLICYAIASILYTFMISTFLTRAEMVPSIGSILYFASFFPYNIIAEYYGLLTLPQKMAACFSSNIALSLGVNLLLRSEIKEYGVNWNNLWKQVSLEDNLIFGYLIGMLLLDAFLYGLIAWFIDTVSSGNCGVHQPWYHFLMYSYWFRKENISRNTEEMGYCVRSESKYFEKEPTHLRPGIQIKNLHKEFDSKVAIKNLSLNLYVGQISILLGENKSEKSTIISTLIGLCPPTKGKVFINGLDISKNVTDIQKYLGFCPQHDLLFNDLTVSEHLFFYTKIKGKRKIESIEIDHMLSALNLLEKRNTLSISLSAGMKRKLSVIIALLGCTKVVILDEPTNGMDPASRMSTWGLLQHYKKDRTILMTTNYMDEANILGDRIAIMAKGTLQCCGSSNFLKHIYGPGYHIIIVKEPHCDIEMISRVIWSHVPKATLQKHIGSDLSFILPKDNIHSVEALFTELKQKKNELGIASFGVSITTIQDVFLKVNMVTNPPLNNQHSLLEEQKLSQEKEMEMDIQSKCERPVYSKLNEIATIKFNTGFSLYRQQFCSMFIKRALFSWRSWRMMLLQIIVNVTVTTYLLMSVNLNYDVPSRELDLSQYGHTTVPYSVSGNSNLTLNLIKNLQIFLKSKNQTFLEVKGNITEYIIETKACHAFSIAAFSIKVEENKTILTILFNNEAFHSAAISLEVLDNILFKSLSGPRASIQVFNKPQPLDYATQKMSIDGIRIVLCLAFGMAIVISGFCVLTVTERISSAKHIQFVSGVHVLIYWVSALLSDLMCYFIHCCLLLGVFKYCGVEAFVENFQFLQTMMIFMLYGWSVVPLVYLGSFLFSSITTAYVKLTLFNYFSHVFTVVVYSIAHRSGIEFVQKYVIKTALMLLPSYNFVMSLSKVFDDYEIKKLCSRKNASVYLNCTKERVENSIYNFGEDGIAHFLLALAFAGFFYITVLFCLETTLWDLKNFVFHKIIYNALPKTNLVTDEQCMKDKDQDAEEKEDNNAVAPKLNNTPLVLKEVTKIYFKCPIVNAVRNISLIVQKSECFGLLGLDGAGKSTTFKMITGKETTTSGVVLIDGINIIENIWKVRSKIGYSPERNPMMTHMTGRELLIMYARLRGVPEPDIYKYVEAFIFSLHLETHADEFVSKYSFGSKRRLNAAIALMGNTSVVFLDEPSSSRDPTTMNFLQDTVTWMCKNGKAVVISSHSMEDCEAICTRMAIMVNGTFKYLGSPQHLKHKFCNIYNLTAKIKTDQTVNKLPQFKEFVTTNFPGSVINQEHEGFVGFYFSSKKIQWGKVFDILEEAKASFNLEDYSVNQITMEQIFLTFANTDKMENDEINLL
ncbi:phospholipid-transporting ATPase ABCA3-like [Suncus etruscus]|uniref:phospholipid-transporting ATPase ABCA3-like n=1 Tax=Suncus etruscus TaxID=109475 RepID=UPI00210FCB54|nr:phospholipid-transporting ATPase ABCA3-like [Suncus etruscus]